MKNNVFVPVIIAALIFGTGGFFGGMKYQQSKRSNFTFGNGGQGGRRFMMQTGGSNTSRDGFRPVAGEIVSTDDKSITVKLPDGSSKIILLSQATTINKATAGSSADLKNGERVSVFGTVNSDGSVTATNIQLGVMMGGRMGAGAPSAAPQGQ